MECRNLEIFKSTTKSFEIVCKKDGQTQDITDWTFYLTVKENMKDSDANAKIAKVVTSHSDPTNGKTLITLSADDTNIDTGNYYYSLDWKDDEDNQGILFMGRLRIIDPVLDTRS